MKTKQTHTNKERYHEQRGRAVALLGGVCVVCGTPDRLHFDHINMDRKDRQHAISQMLLRDWDVISEELKKCQLLCISCHAKKSVTERGWGEPKHGTLTRYMRLNCRCTLCKLKGKLNNRRQYERRMGYIS